MCPVQRLLPPPPPPLVIELWPPKRSCYSDVGLMLDTHNLQR